VTLPRFLDLADPSTAAGKALIAIAIRGEASAADLVADTGLSRSSVSGILAELRGSGVVLDVMQAQKGVGRPTLLHALNPALGLLAGVLLGLGEIRVILCDAARQVLAEEHVLLNVGYSPQDGADVAREVLTRLTAAHGLRPADLIGTGLAVSAPISREGTVLYGGIFPTWNGTRIGPLFAGVLGCPVHVDNESHCGALYEMSFGAAKGESDFIMFKFDLGTGGAIVLDGKIRRGANGFGGEFGHLAIDPRGALCRCGNRGCLDTFTGGNQLLGEAARTLGHGISLPDFVAEARAGHPGYRRLIEDAGDYAGIGLAMMGSSLNPPMFLITGGLALAGELFLGPMRASYERHTLCRQSLLPESQRTRFLTGTSPATDNVLGAVALVLRQEMRMS
jgi:predicted NBD/HSP70 family sugar kinase